MLQTPALHVVAAFVNDGHTVLHVPQAVTSLLRLWHVPLQQVLEPGHGCVALQPIAHALLTQIWPPGHSVSIVHWTH
jgi:hypothetical protein